jgi:hypothetical protein
VKGKWVDATNPLPATPTQGQLEEEVRRAVNFFNNESEYPQAVYLIALPPGHGDPSFTAKGGEVCAWHSKAWNNNFIDVKFFPYITLPYMPESKGCATNSVNQGFDFSGHGIFDGVSKVAGHEWAEVLTDPQIDAWYDDAGKEAETGDKCNTGPNANIGASGSYFAAQPLWSNNDSSCVLAGIPSADQNPSSFVFGPGVRYSFSAPVTVQLANNGDLDLPLIFINNSPWYLDGVNTADFILGNNTCGKTLHPSDSCQVQVTFRPLEFGTRQATLGARVPFGLTITGNVTPLSGEGVPQWAQFDQNIVLFGDGVFIGSTARATVKLDNTGDTPNLVRRASLAGTNASDFWILSDGCSDRMLRPSESCMLTLGFAPTATAERRAELQITDQANKVFGVPVLGTGLGPLAELSTSRLVFDDVVYDSGGVSTGGEIPVSGELQKEITLTNTGQSRLEVQRLQVTEDFALVNNGCLQFLQPNDSCAIRVRLVPTHYQVQSGRLVISDNTSESPHEVELTGSVAGASVSLVPDQVQFGPVPVGMTSSPQMVRLENLEGEVALNIQSIAATGDFMVTSSDCPSILVIGSCSIAVALTPAAAGRRTGTLVVTDDAPRSPHRIPLIGEGR